MLVRAMTCSCAFPCLSRCCMAESPRRSSARCAMRPTVSSRAGAHSSNASMQATGRRQPSAPPLPCLCNDAVILSLYVDADDNSVLLLPWRDRACDSDSGSQT